MFVIINFRSFNCILLVNLLASTAVTGIVILAVPLNVVAVPVTPPLIAIVLAVVN